MKMQIILMALFVNYCSFLISAAQPNNTMLVRINTDDNYVYGAPVIPTQSRISPYTQQTVAQTVGSATILCHGFANNVMAVHPASGKWTLLEPNRAYVLSDDKTTVIPYSLENSDQTILKKLGNAISENPVLDALARITTFLSVGDFVYRAATGPQSLHYFGLNIAVGLLASIVGKQTTINKKEYPKIYAGAAGWGAFFGFLGACIRIIKMES